ncbi:hypothetical protein [Yeosuana marina]|uniref:hypothetical protein n=1 Tax=Yeosuana marina TaxID=1565536 RepID=UPI0030ED363C|tara:strand:+ start:1543 stop:1989 length:447 start_codon:yes stop_codon:yes gene_type:complete
MKTKQLLLQICNEHVDKRIIDYKNEIDLIKDSIASNDKISSEEDDAGNEKLFNDLEKNVEYLNNAQKTKEHLKLIKTNIEFKDVVLGSIVKTDSIHFYISISIGKIDLEGETYYAISLQSPIGQLLKNKIVDSRFVFNDKSYLITEIR